jgi:hypothetical protein
MADEHDTVPGCISQAPENDPGVLATARTDIVARKINRHNPRAGGRQLRRKPLPTPRTVPGAVHQRERRHRRQRTSDLALLHTAPGVEERAASPEYSFQPGEEQTPH